MAVRVAGAGHGGAGHAPGLDGHDLSGRPPVLPPTTGGDPGVRSTTRRWTSVTPGIAALVRDCLTGQVIRRGSGAAIGGQFGTYAKAPLDGPGRWRGSGAWWRRW